MCHIILLYPHEITNNLTYENITVYSILRFRYAIQTNYLQIWVNNYSGIWRSIRKIDWLTCPVDS